MAHRRSARGVALLSALILLALMTAIASTLAVGTGFLLRRQQAVSGQEQAWQLLGATEALSSWALRDELAEPGLRVHHGQRWHQTLGPIEPVPGIRLEAQLADLQGRFNLNALLNADGEADPQATEFFERLLQATGIEPGWALRLTDWMDSDDRARSGGGEDAYHASASPSARPANQLLISTSELLALPGFGMERYQRLSPHVTALPRDAGLNLCTATAAVLDSLSGEQQWVSQPERLASSQTERCFPGEAAVRNSVRDPQAYVELKRSLNLSEESRYFGLQTWVQIGSAEFALYSVLRLERVASRGAEVRIINRESIQ
jgi:general secretion pathway protein K